MSRLTLFLFLALITYVLNASNITSYVTQCRHLKIGDLDFSTLLESYEEDYCSSLQTDPGFTHCCYFESKNGINGCYQITDDQYENVVRYKKYLRDQIADDDLGIHCSSKFISLSLFAVLALLF